MADWQFDNAKNEIEMMKMANGPDGRPTSFHASIPP